LGERPSRHRRMESWYRGAGWWGGIGKIMDLIEPDILHGEVSGTDTHRELWPWAY